MKRVFILLLVFLSACGVMVPYLYDSKKLQDHLAISMPKEQVLEQLGKPDRVVQNGGRQTIWEYRLYPKGEWAGYLIHCPFFPNCYFPAEPRDPYHVVLQDDRVCMWGTPNVVRSLVGMCRTIGQSDRKDQARKELRVTVVPVFMPPVIFPLPQRLAIVPVNAPADNEANSWLDLTLNFLRTRHPEIVLVEREDLQTLLHEVLIQYGGQVDDETTIRVGKLLGADSLLLYRLVQAEDRPSYAAAFELRLFKIESGTTVFRQMTSVNQDSLTTKTSAGQFTDDSRRLILEEAMAYGLASLTAAFGDNPLGIVFDYSWTGDGIKLLDVLQGGPASRAGLKRGDQILNFNHQPIRSWSDRLALPAQLNIRRDGLPLELIVNS